ncbi:MAG TPA: tripartite tricarboxylate transporter substrate binding protein [Burkholderiales bacterium]|nr:tripartite tricarboxylate transporter substrate binding protein [Burkholderiales bacterium]
MKQQQYRIAALAAAMAFAVAPAAHAQTPYPAKPIRVVDAYPPGGSTDIIARLVGAKFQEIHGQQWIIDNRGGASGIIGADYVAKSAPDGYTLLVLSGNHVIHPAFYKNMPYDIVKGFAPITWMSDTAMVLAVHPSVPAKNVKELIAAAKRTPGKLNFASAGAGTATHMVAELLKITAGLNAAHIPYKGGAPAALAAISGEVDVVTLTMPVAAPHVKRGTLRALAVTREKRSKAMPELPTIAESVPGFSVNNAAGLAAPAGTPRDAVVKIQQTVVRILNMPDVRDKLLAIGMEPVGDTPEHYADYIRSEVAKWTKVVKVAGVETQAW